MDGQLFEAGPVQTQREVPVGLGTPRVEWPVRNQVQLVSTSLDDLVAEEHQVRAVWGYVEKLDLSALYDQIQSLEGGPGRPAIDPRILVALWLYAVLEGVGSARALERLCEEHLAYMWICGGVSVNYHTLSDFRSRPGAFLDGLLTESVARLMAAGLVTLNRVAHDGYRVRASAGTGSFRRKKTLERFQQEARAQVEALREELDKEPGASDLRRKAARERAVRERQERVEEALRQLDEVRAKKKHEKDEARVSVTDPDARTMHMPDGGFRPAYNVQLSSDTKTQVIVGVDVIKSGSDGDQLEPAVKQVHERHETTPQEFLVDGGFVKQEAIENLAAAPEPCRVYAPVPAPKVPGRPTDRPFVHETPHVTEWRERMGTPEAKEIYKERAATAECVNALAHNRGLQQFLVRGLKKVRAVALWFAIAHNVLRTLDLLGGSG